MATREEWIKELTKARELVREGAWFWEAVNQTRLLMQYGSDQEFGWEIKPLVYINEWIDNHPGGSEAILSASIRALRAR